MLWVIVGFFLLLVGLAYEITRGGGQAEGLHSDLSMRE